MGVKLIMQYLYDNGGIDLVKQVLRDINYKSKENFALDELYTVMSDREVKKYVLSFTPDKYREWFRKNHPHWSDEQVNENLFA